MNPDRHQWEPCSPGVIQETAIDELAGRRTMLKVLGGLAAVATLAAGAFVGALISGVNQPADQSPTGFAGGIACITVKVHMDSYTAGKLTEELSSRITKHLLECSTCRAGYHELTCNQNPGCRHRPPKPTFKDCTDLR